MRNAAIYVEIVLKAINFFNNRSERNRSLVKLSYLRDLQKRKIFDDDVPQNWKSSMQIPFFYYKSMMMPSNNSFFMTRESPVTDCNRVTDDGGAGGHDSPHFGKTCLSKIS